MQRPLTGVSWRTAGRETVAGVTLLAIAVPLNIGYAQIAGLPPTAGLYALVVPGIVYALLVSSRQVAAPPDAAAAALVASSIGGPAVADSTDYLAMAGAQAIFSGALFTLAAVFKLGFLANFLSKPLLVGFVGGLALDILVSQLAKMLGVATNSGGGFIEKTGGLFLGLPTINGWSVLIAGRRFSPAVPWALVVLVTVTTAVVTTRLEADGRPGSSLLDPAPVGTPTAPGVLVIRMAPPLFFANGSVFADAVKSGVSSIPGVHHVVIDLEAVTDVDITGAEAFAALADWLSRQKVELAYSRPRRQIIDRLRSLGVAGGETIYPTNREALAALTTPTTEST